MIPHRQKPSAGLSLLELILAISILIGSAAVLGQLISIGQLQANKAAELTEAQSLCNNKLNELLSGIELIEPVENQPIAFDSPWDYSIAIEPTTSPDLLEISVTVNWHSDQAMQPIDNRETVVESNQPELTSFRLTRWIRSDDYDIDPTLLGFEETDFMDDSSLPSNY